MMEYWRENHGANFFDRYRNKEVRHLENISIPLDKAKRKHLILTGKNGSGKTSVWEAVVQNFEDILSDYPDLEEFLM